MEKIKLQIKDKEILVYQCHTMVIGSGAAALNCAYHLHNFGMEDLCIVTEKLGGGTSNNSGSDKQTYYKMSVFGTGNDSVYDMAQTLFDGGSMHGDIALVEAALSLQEFFHLVQAGVPFPHNEYGGFVGYKTDHDPKQRATSAGPWTSNQMYGRLLAEVQKANIPILDQLEVVSLLKEEERVIGAIAIDKRMIDNGSESFVLFKAENVVLGTGGPGGIYDTSVYPVEHLGSTGIALEIGAVAQNLTEWQYGLASTKYRWNVSGTYQQVIPRYFSVDVDGNDEQEFLNQYFPSMAKLATDIFLKGYQWPFDIRKIKNYGSSLIDILVYQETVMKGRRVFMDFRRNPSGAGRLEDFDLQTLEPEALEYLEKSGAFQERPIDRLHHMNPMAIQLYQEHGIDLWTEPLEVAVCAQHNNGGLKGNIWWESTVKHLFVVGEANGSHGVYRPGGSALNSGQVGGYRAAQYIAARYHKQTVDQKTFIRQAELTLTEEMERFASILANQATKAQSVEEFRREIQERMSRVGAHIRNPLDLSVAIEEAKAQYAKMEKGQVKIKYSGEILEYFQNRQLCLTHIAVLESIQAYIKHNGGSRGSYLILDPEGIQISKLLEWRYRPFLQEMQDYVLEYQFTGDGHQTNLVPVREIPEDDYWFENVWKSYEAKEIFQ